MPARTTEPPTQYCLLLTEFLGARFLRLLLGHNTQRFPIPVEVLRPRAVSILPVQSPPRLLLEGALVACRLSRIRSIPQSMAVACARWSHRARHTSFCASTNKEERFVSCPVKQSVKGSLAWSWRSGSYCFGSFSGVTHPWRSGFISSTDRG